jgi:hypothetical protein
MVFSTAVNVGEDEESESDELVDESGCTAAAAGGAPDAAGADEDSASVSDSATRAGDDSAARAVDTGPGVVCSISLSLVIRIDISIA